MSRSPRPQYRDEAFVVRTHKLGEADLIVVLLTREHGLVRAVAKGIRRSKSRFGARLDRFCRVNVQIYPGRNRSKPDGGLANVTDAVTVHTFAPQISTDVDRYYAGVVMLEIAELTVQGSGEDAGHIFDGLDQALAALAWRDPGAPGTELPPRTQADRFVLQSLGMAGWAPSLVDCAQCGRAGPHSAFHPLAGGAVCTSCRPPGAFTPPAQSVRVLWLLSRGRPGDLAAVDAVADEADGARILSIAHELLLAHVKNQTESPCRAFSSL
ncbi:DNA repair protein RecO [Corynebacterium glyciniphilum]|uniref:DNA repair protein RecO n=2 Tax=Corynebacterium glyciniphilum TaxID=1404244 RepID=UPI00264A527B|nr:DNA repair protein RecO [Corynebacterium glyciniphilum]MDN6706302.1 DNA repair protein RecO [Corynebacterium glyciniphilum]